jgi:hypothetical protein
LWFIYDAAHIISTTSIAKRKNDCDDRGAVTVFKDLMHSWIGYELVKVLLIFGLTPKVRDDLDDWSPDLFNFFPTWAKKNGIQKKKKPIIT